MYEMPNLQGLQCKVILNLYESPFYAVVAFCLSFLFQSTSTYCVYVLKWSVSTLDSITGGAGIGNPMVLVQVRGVF